MLCKRAALIVFCVLCSFIGRQARAQDCPYGPILYVDADGPGGSLGGSWDDAFQYLQDAIAYANDLCGTGIYIEEIRVAEGTYFPDEGNVAAVTDDDRDSTFLLTGIARLRGGFAGYGATDPDLQVGMSALNGDIGLTGVLNDNARTVLTLAPTWSGVLVERFSIMGGNNDSGAAGGIRAECSVLELVNVNIDSNYALQGGGIDAICDSVLMDNTSISGCMVDGLGGGAHVIASQLTILGGQFLKNAADQGGMMYFTGGDLHVRGADIRRNFANRGGNCVLESFGNAAFVNTGIVGGSTLFSDPCVAGGGVAAAFGSRLTFVRSRLDGNWGDQGAFLDASSVANVEIWDCQVVGNRTPDSPSISTIIHVTDDSSLDIRLTSIRDLYDTTLTVVYASVVDFSVTNSIIHTEYSADCLDATASSTYLQKYSNIEGENNGIDGNIDADPKWTAGIQVDCSMSPAHVDAGDNSFIPLDEFDIDDDSDTFEDLPLDYIGFDRVINSVVDMGASECL